ncbi:unnamed protein product, partial [Prorocentrum cordatum]
AGGALPGPLPPCRCHRLSGATAPHHPAPANSGGRRRAAPSARGGPMRRYFADNFRNAPPPPGKAATAAGPADGNGTPPPTPRLGPPAQQSAAQAPAAVEGEGVLAVWDPLNKPWIQMKDGYHFCLLCHTFATDGHLASERHHRRVEWHEWWGSEEQLSQLRVQDQHGEQKGPPASWGSPEYFVWREGWWWCRVCSQWGTLEHVQGRRHQRRLQWAEWYCLEDDSTRASDSVDELSVVPTSVDEEAPSASSAQPRAQPAPPLALTLGHEQDPWGPSWEPAWEVVAPPPPPPPPRVSQQESRPAPHARAALGSQAPPPPTRLWGAPTRSPWEAAVAPAAPRPSGGTAAWEDGSPRQGPVGRARGRSVGRVSAAAAPARCPGAASRAVVGLGGAAPSTGARRRRPAARRGGAPRRAAAGRPPAAVGLSRSARALACY